MSQSDLLDEIWLETRLIQHTEAPPFDAKESPDHRRERIRRSILTAGLAQAVVGRTKEGKAERYEQAFERIYGEPLQLARPREPKRDAGR